MNQPVLLTEPELADMLKTSQRSIRKARQSGALPYIRLGRLVRYRLNDVVEFLEAATVANENGDVVSHRSPPSGRRAPKVVGFLERNVGTRR